MHLFGKKVHQKLIDSFLVRFVTKKAQAIGLECSTHMCMSYEVNTDDICALRNREAGDSNSHFLEKKCVKNWELKTLPGF